MMMSMRTRILVLAPLVLVLLLGAVPTAAAATAPVRRCTAPYSPDGPGVGYLGMRRSAPAIAWLRAVYGNEADHVVRPNRKNVFRSLALRPCPLRRGAITVWTTNPRAMIRRAWRQPWIRHIDIQWVRVRYGGVDAIRAVRRATTPAMLEAFERELGARLTTVGDDPHRDAIRVGIDLPHGSPVPAGADAIATRLLGLPAYVVAEQVSLT